MKTAKQRLFLMAAAALALACSASEVGVSSLPFASASAQSAVEAPAAIPHGNFDAWRAAAGYPPAAYVPQASWEAVFRAAQR